MITAQTDNSFLGDKIALRMSHLSEEPIKVLDCFGGKGLVWQGVKILTKKDIKVLAIDKIDFGFHLPGDNVRYLQELDLSKFNVIDLDAYGVPLEQLDIIFEKSFTGMIFVTFIQSLMGGLPHKMLNDLGFSKKMIEKISTLYGKRGWQYFLEWLALKGVSKIWHRTKGRKHYLAFNLSGN